MISSTSQHHDADLVSPEEIAEADSLLTRLAHRSKMDQVMCRAARDLQSNPALPMPQLASRLGVSEVYLSRGLRTVLGTDPSRLAHIAHNAKTRREIVNEMPQVKYILGHSQEEISRLMLQAAVLRPFTERLLRDAEIGPGMQVLDLGCGAGDVSMLAGTARSA